MLITELKNKVPKRNMEQCLEISQQGLLTSMNKETQFLAPGEPAALPMSKPGPAQIRVSGY